ncbi:MAG: hypothetical protein ACLR7M_09935, partial [Varibaculum timonense]
GTPAYVPLDFLSHDLTSPSLALPVASGATPLWSTLTMIACGDGPAQGLAYLTCWADRSVSEVPDSA